MINGSSASQGPGLGVEIDPDELEKMRQQGTWRQRTMRRHPEDGNFSDFNDYKNWLISDLSPLKG